MDEISGEINNVLRLTPGRFHDYFIPQIDGARTVEIETLAGMDADITNEFSEFLKNSILSGIGVPRTFIDNLQETDFARTLAVQNANFSRKIIKYQKLLEGPFTKLYRRLYENEYRFYSDADVKEESIDSELIEVQFPSPVALNQSNLTEQISVALNNADMIAGALVSDMEADAVALTHRLRKEIVKDLAPGIDWETYEQYLTKVKEEYARSKAGTGRDEEDKADLFGGFSNE